MITTLYLIVTSQVIEIETNDNEFTEDEVHDTLMNDLLDGQDTIHESSDGRIEFVPKEIVGLQVKRVGGIDV